MRTIAILNLKGGVGKTVTAVNTAYNLSAKHKQRVLLIDADSQCNATEFFGGDPALGNLAEVLQPGDGIDGGFGVLSIHPTKYKRLDLLAASDALMDLDLTKLETNQVKATALRELVEHLTSIGDYDFVLIDCPPAFNAASAAALLAADEVIIPIKLDAFSLRGMSNLLRQVVNMQRINPRLRVAGCLPTMYYKSPEISDALSQLRASRLPVFQCCIRRTNKVDGMTFAQEPISIFSPRSSAGIDYQRFVHELLKGGGHRG